MNNIRVGDTMFLPVYMRDGAEVMKGTVVGLYPHGLYRVEFKIDDKRILHESYPYYGKIDA